MEEQASIITVLVYSIIFITLLMVLLMLFFHYSRKRIIGVHLENIKLELSQQKLIHQATIATQEEERKRIAQDLHDEISSKLNVVSLTTNLLLEDTTITPEQKKSLVHILKITTTTLESSRKIAHDLLPPVLEKFGLNVALEELFEDYIKTEKLQILYEIADNHMLSPNHQLHLFRIAQELLNNSVKHGKATQIIFRLNFPESKTHLYFDDNGCGFDTHNLDNKTGLGLQNIFSRASILNCTAFFEQKQNGRGIICAIKSIQDGN